MAYLLDVTGNNPVAPMDLAILSGAFSSALYAIALFRFHMFDLIPIARGTMIDQMREGMLVLDRQMRIADLNPAAERIFDISSSQVIAKNALQVLPMFPELGAILSGSRAATLDLTLGTGTRSRHYNLHLSPLEHDGGFLLGHLIILHDVTEQRRALAQIVEQQRALATLEERSRLAHELHDSLGQVLGYVKMQAEAARELLTRNRGSEAEGYLTQLAAVAQEGHAEVREYIAGARVAMSDGRGFRAALAEDLRRFGKNHRIATKLSISPEVTDDAFEPMVAAQLLRIVQETLANVRKHAAARTVNVELAAFDTHVEATVQDDGAGFDTAQLESDGRQRFGLRIMRERAQEVGGNIRVWSEPGKGTRVIIGVPLRKRAL